MTGKPAQFHNDCGNFGGCTGRIWIFGMADYADDAVLGHRAGGPGGVANGAEPDTGIIMGGMAEIDQRDQNIDVEQKGHGSASRKALTVSSVTSGASVRGDRRGMPLRSLVSNGLQSWV